MAVAVEQMVALGHLSAVGRMPAARVSSVASDLAQCFGNYDASLRAFLTRHTGSQHDAEDLAQEVYLRLTRMPGLEHVRSRKAFVFRTAINLLRDRSRRMYTRVQKRAVSAHDVEVADIGNEPSSMVESWQALAQLQEALSTLKPTTRLAFVLHRIEEWSHAEVAAHMGVSTSMVEKHVSAAAACLRAAGVGCR